MPDDLEDFLRRAAARRQAKAAQQPPAQPAAPAPRPKPQYSDRRTERVVRPREDEILVAEVVEEPNEFQKRQEQVRKAKQKAQEAAAELASAQKKQKSRKPKPSVSSPPISRNPAENLIALLQRPGGIQQAVLLREILDRPEHRW